MNDWFTPDQILAANKGELPGTVQNLNRLAVKSGWRRDDSQARRAPGRGGGWLYHLAILPQSIQARLSLAKKDISPTQITDHHDLWRHYEGLSKAQKTRCETRLKHILAIDLLVVSGSSETAAARNVSDEHGISTTSLYNWKSRLIGHMRADWLAALAPIPKKTADRAYCHQDAYDALKSDFLRPENPTFSSCYRRMVRAAKKRGWEPIPCERSLRRHLNSDVSCDVQKLARGGYDRAKPLYPAQKRDRSHFHAMQAVNTDGHKFDVFVKWPDGRIIRPLMVAIQDLYSGKIIAWRLSDSENKETVRLTIGDMIENFGIPDKAFLDNGRAFASKWISGGAKNRFKFKIREEDPRGLLITLGVALIWTTPYSGQSKPIERAFRDLADTISRHPVCAGAWTGNTIDAKPENYGNAAVPFEEFKALVEQEIIEHNSRTGRRTKVANGRSFDAAFEESLAKPETIVRWASKAQRSLWLLAADQVTAQRGNGEIRFFENRYWHPDMTAYAAKKVTVRFDPDALQGGIKVYDLEDKFICDAQCFESAGFDDVSAARSHNRNRNAYFKALKEQKRLAQVMSVEELARLYKEKPTPPSTPQEAAPPTKITRLAVTSNGAVRLEDDDDCWDEESEAGFSRALRLVSENEI